MQQPYHLIFDKPELFKDYHLSDQTEPIIYLPNFNTINIIVGANNSGKSRFMRYLMSSNKNIIIRNDDYEGYNVIVDQFNRINKSRSHMSSYVMSSYPLNRTLVDISESNIRKIQSNPDFKITYQQILNKPYEEISPKINFIPTLRTAHSIYENTNQSDVYTKIEKDIYSQTLNKYYDLGRNINVFTGMHLYKDILNSRNAKKEVRKRFESFEGFISQYFFDGKEIDIVAEFNKDNSLEGKNDAEVISVHIDGEKDRSLFELGDGIQALIILMYHIYMADNNSFFFIDEPELNLHPGMQRLFLEQISTNPELVKKKLTYIISTHSNHFLDLTLEKHNVSIYSFSSKNITKEEDKKFVIKNVNRGDNEILKHLGVNNSSVFLANCSIWVEGVSDRNYIKAFLKSYLNYLNKSDSKDYKSLKEDIDYAFFEYAGSNIEHYLFEEEMSEDEEKKIESEINALALSNKIFLLADSDNAEEGSAKAKRLEKLEAIKKNNFTAKIIRQVREIENLLTNDIWKEVLINFCNKKLLKDNETEIKNKIEKVLSKFDSDDFKGDYIGNFLNKIDKSLDKIGQTNVLNKIYEGKRTPFGTFIYKSELSKYVLEANFEWEILQKSKEIKELTEEIYKFITDSMN